MAKCGNCLIESVDIVEIGADGKCPKCGVDYSKPLGNEAMPAIDNEGRDIAFPPPQPRRTTATTMSTIVELSVREGKEALQAFPYQSHGPQCCSPADQPPRRFYCTREEGHDGPHATHAPGPIVVATWEV